MSLVRRLPVLPEPEPEAVLPDAPGIARLWPELAGVPWDRVVTRAIEERPLYVGVGLIRT